MRVNVKVACEVVTAARRARLLVEDAANLSRVLGGGTEHTRIGIDDGDPAIGGNAGMFRIEVRSQRGPG